MSGSKVKYDDLLDFNPITDNQEKVFNAWDEGENLILTGSAGTGKTFLGMYLGLESVLERGGYYDKLIIIRSVVSVREVGYLPGKLEEKTEPFQAPYKAISEELFSDKAAYNKLVSSHQMQNLNFHELDSVMTRLGENCKIIFCGDYKQTDFHGNEKDGIMKFLNIMERMKYFTRVEFGWDDIVRSGIVRDYITTKEMMGIN